MSPTKTLIYAELLPNIRQISIIAALASPSNATTKATLFADGRKISLDHEGETISLDLPGQVASGSQLQKPSLGVKELSWRVPISGAITRASLEDANSNEAPWSSKDLGDDAEILCRSCNAVLVERGTIKTWKDLPSENWAEMMDFWHCHKPDKHDENCSSGYQTGVEATQEAKANSGYGANTKFTATPGTGFVDLTTFLLAPSDCSSVLIQDSQSRPSSENVFCSKCRNYVGYFDTQSEGIRLWKWRFSIPPPRSSQPLLTPSPMSPSTSSIISSRLFSQLQAQCSSRFTILPPKTSLSPPTRLTMHSQSSLTRSPSTSASIPSSSSLQPHNSSHHSNSSLAGSIEISQASSCASSQPITLFLDLWVLAGSVRYSSTCSSLTMNIDHTSSATPNGSDSSTSFEEFGVGKMATSTKPTSSERIPVSATTRVIPSAAGSPTIVSTTATSAAMKVAESPKLSSPPNDHRSNSHLASTPSKEPGTLAMKVFWKVISKEEALSSIEKTGIEEFELPLDAIHEIHHSLRDSANFLPLSARKFREWDVGLLERYEG